MSYIEKNNFTIILTQNEKKVLSKILSNIPPMNIYDINRSDLNELDYFRFQFPKRVAQELIKFKRTPNKKGILYIKNTPIDRYIPQTPFNGKRSKSKETLVSEYSLLLFMLYMGDPIAYEDEKEGELVQNICPVRGEERKQENSGSHLLKLHTENGFHPYKPDHIGLLSLRDDRNQEAKTLVSSIQDALFYLPSTAIELLRKPLYRIKPSTSFTSYNNKKYKPKLKPILTGDIFHPNLCIDFNLMETYDSRAQWALESLKKQLNKNIFEVTLAPGDLLIIDNNLVVHGRTKFRPYYDGKDRWLQRMFTVCDIRSSTGIRSNDNHRCSPLHVISDYI